MKYIAYGSNMSIPQMRRRCPDAKLIGVGRLRGARLEFYTHATVVPSISGSVPVAVWEISSRDEQRLDAYESVPSYYKKEIRRVHMSDGSEIDGLIYIMNQIHRSTPADAYYGGIRDAYIDLGLDSEINRVLVPALKRSRSMSDVPRRP